MQTFKQIPYQNYIQLKFNTRNLQQAQRQQALIKYKRNSQLLAEIFSFKKLDNNQSSNVVYGEKMQNEDVIISQSVLSKHRQQIAVEKQKAQQQLQGIKQSTRCYEQTIKSINQARSKQELLLKINEIRQEGLEDKRHPFFCQGSPFMMYTGDQEILQVKCIHQKEEEQDGMNLLELV